MPLNSAWKMRVDVSDARISSILESYLRLLPTGDQLDSLVRRWEWCIGQTAARHGLGPSPDRALTCIVASPSFIDLMNRAPVM